MRAKEYEVLRMAAENGVAPADHIARVVEEVCSGG